MLNEDNLRIDTFRVVGADPPSVRVRVTHLPTGIVHEREVAADESVADARAKIMADIEGKLRERGLLDDVEDPPR